MKPELIFIDVKDGKAIIAKEELKYLVDKAYKAGQADASHITTTPWTVHSTLNTNPMPVRDEGNWAQDTPTQGTRCEQ